LLANTIPLLDIDTSPDELNFHIVPEAFYLDKTEFSLLGVAGFYLSEKSFV
jgi:hypothetical protein